MGIEQKREPINDPAYPDAYLSVYPPNTQTYTLTQDANGHWLFSKPADDPTTGPLQMNCYRDCCIVVNMDPKLAVRFANPPFQFHKSDPAGCTSPIGRYFLAGWQASQVVLVANVSGCTPPHWDPFNILITDDQGNSLPLVDPQIKNPGDDPGHGLDGRMRTR